MSIRDELARLAAERRAGTLTAEAYESEKLRVVRTIPDALSPDDASDPIAKAEPGLIAAIGLALLPSALIWAVIVLLGMPGDLAATAAITMLAAITVSRFTADPD